MKPKGNCVNVKTLFRTYLSLSLIIITCLTSTAARPESHSASGGLKDLDTPELPAPPPRTSALQLLDEEIIQTEKNLEVIAERLSEIAEEVARLSSTVTGLRRDAELLTRLAAEFQSSVRLCATQQAEMYDLEANDDVPKLALREQARKLSFCRREQNRMMNAIPGIRLQAHENQAIIHETERDLRYLRPILRSVGEEQQAMNAKLQRLNGIRFDYENGQDAPD